MKHIEYSTGPGGRTFIFQPDRPETDYEKATQAYFRCTKDGVSVTLRRGDLEAMLDIMDREAARPRSLEDRIERLEMRLDQIVAANPEQSAGVLSDGCTKALWPGMKKWWDKAYSEEGAYNAAEGCKTPLPTKFPPLFDETPTEVSSDGTLPAGHKAMSFGTNFTEKKVVIQAGDDQIEITPVTLLEVATMWLHWAALRNWTMYNSRGLRIVSTIPLDDLEKALQEYRDR